MASPHTAGLLAYLLSLYPSKSFNPDMSADSGDLTARSVTLSMGTVYKAAHAALPGWISGMLPAPQLIEQASEGEGEGVAPVPPVLVSPKALKKALLGLATTGVFVDLPELTPNLLIFNNATA